MNEFAIRGRNWTIRIFASVILISIYTIVTYNINISPIDTKKLIQQIIRFSLTVTLMYFVLKGKKWSIIVFTVLFSIAIFMAFLTLFSSVAFAAKIPLIVMIIIYSIAVYHLNFSKNFKEYLDYMVSKK